MTTVHCPVRTTSPQGHNPSLGCREAVETADYTAYRDKAPLVPDSAVMVRELFAETIDLFADTSIGWLAMAATGATKMLTHETIVTTAT